MRGRPDRQNIGKPSARAASGARLKPPPAFGMKRPMEKMGNPFTAHPRALGMTWLSHGVGALGIGGRMIVAGAACLVHAVVPALFTQTAGRTVMALADHMNQRKSNCPNWPDYEI